jgi:hypothetical protein
LNSCQLSAVSRQLLANGPGERRIVCGPYDLNPYPLLAGIVFSPFSAFLELGGR